MAEGLLLKLAGRRGLNMEARSAGTAAMDGIPISGHAASILQETGAVPNSQGSKTLTPQLVSWADLILTMTMNHKKHVLQRYPAAIDKIYTLKEYAGSDDQETNAILAELERLTSELQISKALNQPVTHEQQMRLFELEAQLPNYDIADPFGGNLDAYRYSAEEIETAIRKIVDKLAGG